MKLRVWRAASALSGELVLPGDKSISHRAALLAAMAPGESLCENFLVAGVTQVMVDALRALGVKCDLSASTLRVRSEGLAGWRSPVVSIDCGHSGTTLRLLAGALTAANLETKLTGSAGLRRRPMDRVVDPLRQMGARLQAHEGRAPLKLEKRSEEGRLRGIVHHTPVASAQVKSAILLAGLQADSLTTVIEPGPSRDHTERMLKAMGVDLAVDATSEGLPRVRMMPLGDGFLRPLRVWIPGDFSSAAFLLAAAAILPDSRIRLRRTGLNSTRTGLLDALEGMGHQLLMENRVIESGESLGDIALCSGDASGVVISGDMVVRMIDEFPAFAVAAAFAQGRTIVRDAAELRHKESDRISGICQGLSSLGVAVQAASDGFILEGQAEDLRGGVALWPGKDHRLAMAFVLAGLRCQKPILIHGAEIIQQSFPTFLQSLRILGVDSFEVLDD